MIKNKNKKLLAALVAGISVCSSVMPLSAGEVRDQNSHMYGGGLGTSTQPSSGTSSGGSGSSGSTSSGTSSGSTSGTSSGTTSGSGTSSGSGKTNTGNSSGTGTNSGGNTNASSGSGGNTNQPSDNGDKPTNNSGSTNSGKTNNGSSSSSSSSQSDSENSFSKIISRLKGVLSGLSDAEKKLLSDFTNPDRNYLGKQALKAKVVATLHAPNSSGLASNVSEKVTATKTVGDPVVISAGKFFTSDADLSLNYGSSVFDVVRSYSSQEYPDGALGKNWSSVFDARIIRGFGDGDYNLLKQKIEECKLSYAAACEEVCYSGVSVDCTVEMNDAANQIAELEKLCKEFEEGKNKNSELNKYVAHGYEDFASQMNPDGLIMVESDGSIYSFSYSRKEQKYQGVSPEIKNRISIEKENDGFLVRYIDGTLKHFDKWGMLWKIEDKFSSSIEFEYFDSIVNNVRRVHSVSKNGIPVLDVEWKENRISKITDLRKSICVSYKYDEDGSLISFIDSDGDAFAYDYDCDGDLVKVIKPDGTFTHIQYSTNGKSKAKRVASVTNEEGFDEYFSVDESAGKTIYTDPDGNLYIYNYDDDKITHEESSAGYSINRTYNEDGLVETLSDPYKKVSYTYDEFKNLVGAKYNDGTTEMWIYSQPYNLLSEYKDRDGVKTKFYYSSNGGLEKIERNGSVIQTYARDSAGRVIAAKGINRNGNYVYDSNGLLIADANGTYAYDSQDRIVSYDTKDGYSWCFGYTDDNKIQTAVLPGNLYEKNEYNKRKDLVKKVQKDLLSGETRIYEYAYDSRHLPVSVFIGCGKNDDAAEKNIYKARSIEYYPSGKTKSITDWNRGDSIELDAAGVKRSYAYAKGNLSSIKISFVDSSGTEIGKSYEETYGVSYSGGKKLMTVKDGLGNKTVISFNDYGFIEKITDPCERSVSCEYSPAGVLKNETGIYGDRMIYGWDNAVDQVSRITDSYSKIVDYIYDENGRLKFEKYADGEKNEYVYFEESGVKTTVKKSASSTTAVSYDSMGVEVARKITDAEGNVIYDKAVSVDKRNNIVSQRIGGVHVENKFNAWGDVCENLSTGVKYAYDENGSCILIDDGKLPVEIQYNVFNKISSVKIGDRFTKYAYDAGGNLLKVFDNAGIVAEYAYDDSGNMISERGRANPVREYEYDNAGNLIKIIEAGQTIQTIEYSKDLRRQKITDAKGKSRIIDYDGYGNAVSVTDRLGKTKSVSLNRSKGTTVFTDFNKNKMTVAKSNGGNLVKKTFGDGSSEKIQYDSLGSIVKMENAFGTQKYSFDSAHLLSSVVDGEKKISYAYNDAGRLVSMTTDNHDFNYDYFANGVLKSVNHGDFKRTFSYDDFGQLVCSTDGNSSKICYEYDEVGRPVLMYQKDCSGNIIFVEGTVYGFDGRIACTFDKDGKVTTYEYDRHGRISRTCIPFAQPFLDEAKEELSECGKNPNDSIILEIASVDSNTKKSVRMLMNKIGLSSFNLDSLQEVWAEYYAYDENGNRISKITPAGKMEYEYDAENRLVKIAGPSPVVFAYDDNGNMLSRKSNLECRQWKYSQNNRLVSSVFSDYKHDSYSSLEYGYDCMGRRIFTKDSAGNLVHNLYDGFTFDKICEWHDKANSYSAQLNGSSENSRIRFRDIDGNDNAQQRAYRVSSASGTCPFDRYYIYAGGNIAAQFNEGYSYSRERLVNEDVFTFCTDQKGSVRTALGVRGDFAFGMNYGLNGQPYFSTDKNLNAGFVSSEIASSFGADIGFNGKQFDSIDKTYNYGFRSYLPELSIFTTEDPIQDGENWYSYCKGDPVNHADMLGLKNVPADMVGLMNDYGKNVLLGNSNSVYLHQQGCYVTVLSGIINTVKNKVGDEKFTPLTVNNEKSNFTKTDQCIVTDWVCENYDIKYDQYIDGYSYRQIADKINELDKSSVDYCLAVKLTITSKGTQRTDVHWVTTDTGTVKIDGNEYVKVIGTSVWDNAKYKEGWLDKDGSSYAPIEDLIGLRAFQNDEPEVKKNK